MAAEGLLTLTFTVTKNKRMIGNVLINSSGFTDFDSSKALENTIKQKSTDLFLTILKSQKSINIKSIEKQLITSLNQFIYQKIERKPLIVPIINVINKE